MTKDAAATVSFYAPTSNGGSGITHYIVTPHIAGAPQAATTVAVGSLTNLTDWQGGTALQANITGLTNSTAYTFKVRARNANGDGTDSAASGANTPLSGLVWGDDFNGSADGAIDPEWYILNRCGYIAQSEVQWYLPSQVRIDGSSNLQLTANHTGHSGISYPSDGNTNRNQTWISGAVQFNSKTFAPASGNTLTVECRQQVCADAGSGFWPGLTWLVGQDWLTAWKTDPQQTGTDSTGKAEIDIAEWFMTGNVQNYGNVSWAGTNEQHNENTGVDLSAAMHTYSVLWKPGVSVVFKRDGTQTYSSSTQIPASGAQFWVLIYLQMLAGGPTTTESCLIDYVRVYDQNLG